MDWSIVRGDNNIVVNGDDGRHYTYKPDVDFDVMGNLHLRGVFDEKWLKLNIDGVFRPPIDVPYFRCAAFVLYSVDDKVLSDREFIKYLRDYPNTAVDNSVKEDSLNIESDEKKQIQVNRMLSISYLLIKYNELEVCFHELLKP